MALASVTATVAMTDGMESIARYAFVVPIVSGAVLFGFTGGLVTAIAAVLLYALFVLPSIERYGMTPEAADGLVTFVILLLVGPLTGALMTWGRRERQRYETVLALQQTLADEHDLETVLARLCDIVQSGLIVSDAAIAIMDGERHVGGGVPGLLRHRAVNDVLNGEPAAFVSDLGGESRPRRLLVVPVLARGDVIGALAVARTGDFSATERTTVMTLGACIGLALENARLAARQRRFADELGEKVARATEQLAETDRAKSMFVATASHDLRTPLTALLGFSELLAFRQFPPDEVRRLATVMQRETERLVRIVDDLLDLSRLERGLAPALRRAAVDVPAAISAVVDAFRGMGAQHTFVVECAGDLPAVDADPDALDRILKNLITNAMKYSPPGPIMLTAAAENGVVAIDVADHGRGIPADVIPRVFDPYYRAPGAAAAARGAGIGLAAVKALVNAHGGAIEVESAPEVGTRFRFTLPRSGD